MSFILGMCCGLVIAGAVGLFLHGVFTTRLLAAIDEELRHRIPL